MLKENKWKLYEEAWRTEMGIMQAFKDRAPSGKRRDWVALRQRATERTERRINAYKEE